MSVGSVARVVSIVLLLVAGGSGALVGLQLLVAMTTAQTGPTGSGAWIAGGIGGYGLVLVAAGAGLVLGRRWARALGIVATLAGIAVLLTLSLVTGGRDEILLGGLIGWVALLACLLVARTERGI